MPWQQPGRDRKIAVAGLTAGEATRQSAPPGAYVHFHIDDPKRRKISAIRFRDRVVHHALCTIIEPRFERLFIGGSYAKRVAKGTHRAIDRLQGFARRHRHVLRADIVQNFASVDHAILLAILRRQIPENDFIALVEAIVASGRGVLDDEYRYVRFAGDDLLAICRPRGCRSATSPRSSGPTATFTRSISS